MDTAYARLTLPEAVESPDVAGETSAHLLPLRSVLILCALVLGEAFVACWLVLQPGSSLPLSGAVPTNLIPGFLCGTALALAIFAAPFFHTESSSPRGQIFGHAMLLALCQTLALCYFLLVASRLTPVEGELILRAGAWIALCALCFILLANAWPRAFAGIVFVWVIALPLVAYVLAELFVSRGNVNWEQSRTLPLHSLVHWMLALSPATVTSAIISRVLPDGTEPGWAPWLMMSGVALCAAAFMPSAPRSQFPKSGMSGARAV